MTSRNTTSLIHYLTPLTNEFSSSLKAIFLWLETLGEMFLFVNLHFGQLHNKLTLVVLKDVEVVQMLLSHQPDPGENLTPFITTNQMDVVGEPRVTTADCTYTHI